MEPSVIMLFTAVEVCSMATDPENAVKRGTKHSCRCQTGVPRQAAWARNSTNP